jgi:hypothetical protein
VSMPPRRVKTSDTHHTSSLQNTIAILNLPFFCTLIEEKDFIEACSEYTDALFQCQAAHKEYFEAFTQALSETEKEVEVKTKIEEGIDPVAGNDEGKDGAVISLSHSMATTASVASVAGPNSEVCSLEDSEEERNHWAAKKKACGFCEFCLDSPCAEYFKPWSRCIDKTEEGM